MYCEIIYNEELESSYITPDKVYGFLYYQSYRTKKKRSKKENDGILKKRKSFDKNDYNKTIDHDGKRGIVDVVGPQVISHYLGALRQQVDIQCM